MLPNGFKLVHNATPLDTWEKIKSYLGLDTGKIDLGFGTNFGQKQSEEGKIPWEFTPYPQNRIVAQFGFRYDYEKDIVVVPGDEKQRYVPKIPALFQEPLLRPLSLDEENNIEFSQCIINVYCPIDEQKKEHSETKKSTSSFSGLKEEDFSWSKTSLGSHIPWHVDDLLFGEKILVYTFGETRALKFRLKYDEGFDDANNFKYYNAYPPHCSYYLLSGESRYLWEHSVPSGNSWRVSITFRTLK